MRTMYAALAALFFCSTMPARAEGPDALKILKRSMDHYDASKTVLCLMQVVMKKPGQQLLIAMDIKAETDGKGSIARSVISMKTEATADKKQRKSQQMMIDNGKELFVVDVSNKKYFSQAHKADRISKLFERSIQNVIATGGVLKVAERVIENRPTYELTNSKPDTTVLILVDKATSDLKSVHMKRKDQISDLTLTNQRFNQPIPAAAFAWTPPAGFQKVTMPSGQ